ncbi:MAG: hypothetical protein QNJ47_19820 [Nostocaceae cyanobacterium]|nr:hypothetical protein [Nostocaceae cyanobacterium]
MPISHTTENPITRELVEFGRAGMPIPHSTENPILSPLPPLPMDAAGE